MFIICRASKESYGDNAICYVEIKREASKCTVQGQITPEHKIKKKPYHLKAVIDEELNIVDSAECFGCAASLGESFLHIPTEGHKLQQFFPIYLLATFFKSFNITIQ